ncbi:heavy metal-binding domain-containing protein [Sphingobacterium siyangense]|uniref:heavy metal-binding domain-containing protein n=1 Tax=Sphingobacterium siyangense TaxID=459529 RepID=UPI00196496B8|nr:heavy metal-binding domain-containing protein [Sphingobacterium siyangense]QRY60511.1 heavy metal-binding domain-containing protein [Sphingobacterium siyangense]
MKSVRDPNRIGNSGANIGASYVDFFGGRSTSYEKKMQEMYKRATETLKQLAQAISRQCYFC